MATTFTKLVSLIAYDAPLTERTDDFYLRAKTMPTTIGLREIAAEVATRLNRNADEIYAILNDAEAVKADAVASSYIVSTPTALIRPCASGTVLKKDLSQSIDHSKVKVYATLSMGSLLREQMEACKLELFTQPAVVGPLLNGATSGTLGEDAAATRAPMAGETIRLTGKNIKLAGDDAAVGVTFISVENPSTTVFVPKSKMTINEPRQLVFVLPAAVTDGLWYVKVATQYGSNGGVVKTVRTYQLDEPVGVGEAYQTQTGSGSGSGDSGSGSGSGDSGSSSGSGDSGSGSGGGGIDPFG